MRKERIVSSAIKRQSKLSPRRYKRHRRFSPFSQHPSFAENQQPLASDPNFRSNNTGLNKALSVHRGAAAGDVHSRNISLSAAGYIRAYTNRQFDAGPAFARARTSRDPSDPSRNPITESESENLADFRPSARTPRKLMTIYMMRAKL